MTLTIRPAPVSHALHVAAPPESAFRTFTEGMGRWWPKSHSIGTLPLAGVVMEPRAGGSWHEVGEDRTTCPWGRVALWEPPSRLVLVWQIGADWKHDPTLETEVEVTFTAEGAGTRVTLEHRGLEAYGARAAEMSGVFASPGGWPGLMAAYASAA
jgi:uncharacterized protein YndB with AHSA1/START domain